MTPAIRFDGVVRNIIYQTFLYSDLGRYPHTNFDINSATPSGLVDFGENGSILGYSKWVSPKRTRSYPFERIYNTYRLPKKVTIIPIMKDEGINGDCDTINFITLSWMNLLNVYIILAWYDNAVKHPRLAGKITHQRFDADYIRQKFDQICTYHQTALHWNIHHFDTEFAWVYHRAMQSYERISRTTGIAMHPMKDRLDTLASYTVDGRFSRHAFMERSLVTSFRAAQRELTTSHIHELLSDGQKGYFSITNWLGGYYHLTADEILFEDGIIVIQEAKNASRKGLPRATDIKDGLFKLILFANMDELYFGGQQVNFATRLKLTGKFKGSVRLPADAHEIDTFISSNAFSRSDVEMLRKLNDESRHNAKLNVVITGSA